MNFRVFSLGSLVCLFFTISIGFYAQQKPSMYGDAVKADVKLKYVYSLEEALKKAKEENKPIFFNCFADWAVPCHSMNQVVFSDSKFGEYMNNHFVNLFIDVSEKNNRPIAERFNIKHFAHYLVLDADGNILLRMVGGKKLPEFQQDVNRALNPKTTLLATERIFKSGKYSKKDLLNYLYALDLADEEERYAEVSQIYLKQLKEKDYSKKENWRIFSKAIKNTESPFYAYLINHKKDFVKQVGADKVNAFINNLYFPYLSSVLSGETPYDAQKILDVYLAMQKAELPDSFIAYKVYPIAKYRGEKRYEDLLDYMRKEGDKLGYQKVAIELTFDFPDMTEEQKEKVVAYLQEEAKSETPGNAKHLLNLVKKMNNPAGIQFQNLSFEKALERATLEGKLIFLDCYTSWCAPCKMMAKDVFTNPSVADVFNKRFINLKMDMEKGEGKILAKRFKVSAYPTMLILNNEGKVLKTIVGARKPKALIEEVSTLNEE